MPDAVSSSLPGNLANFTGISPSSSTVVSPPLLSVPISYAVPPPASTLNPIFQPAIQAQTPLVHSAVPKQDSILQAAVNTPDPILQATRSEMDLQAEAVAQAQSRLRALTQLMLLLLAMFTPERRNWLQWVCFWHPLLSLRLINSC